MSDQEMSNEKAIELLSELMHADEIDITQDEKTAIAKSVAALIAEKLHLEGG